MPPEELEGADVHRVAGGPPETPRDARGSRQILGNVVGGIACLGLVLLLIPVGVVPAYFAFSTWQGALVAFGGAATAFALWRLTKSRALLFGAGALTATVAWVCAVVLSGWDIEGRLDDGDEPFEEVAVLYTSLGAGMLAVVFGLAGAFVARNWWARNAGIGIGIMGGFAVTGVVFL
jgi:hypothetical protein